MTAKLRLLVQHGLGTLRAGEKHGLQPALLIHWAQHLTDVVRLLTAILKMLVLSYGPLRSSSCYISVVY